MNERSKEHQVMADLSELSEKYQDSNLRTVISFTIHEILRVLKDNEERDEERDEDWVTQD